MLLVLKLNCNDIIDTMQLSVTTPSILFPAITLLMLAYTNRFLALSQLIRSLQMDYKDRKIFKTLAQIKHLRLRLFLIQLMQALGAVSILICTLSIAALLLNKYSTGLYLFYISLVVFLGSIISSLIEIILSSKALNILLADLEEDT